MVSRLRTQLAETKKKNTLTANAPLSHADDINFDALHLYNSGWLQGVDTDEISGRAIHVKFLKTKLRFRFPSGGVERVHVPVAQQQGYYIYRGTDNGGNAMNNPGNIEREGPIMRPTKVELVWGWIKRPKGYPLQAEQPAGQQNLGGGGVPAWNNLTATRQAYHDEMLAIVRRDFGDAEDRLEFHERRPSLVKYLGRTTIKCDRSETVGSAEAARNVQMAGAQANNPVQAEVATKDLIPGPPDTYKSISWPCNRLLKLTESTRQAADGQSLLHYNNEGWQPFFFVYNPDRVVERDQPGENIQVASNTQIWYTDA